MKCVSFTEEECRALYEILSPESLLTEGLRDIDDLTRFAVAKVYAAAGEGEDIPEHLRALVADISTLELPHGLLSILQTAHTGQRGVSLPRQITAVSDLCGYSAGELTATGVLWDRAVEDIRAVLKTRGLKLKGE